MYIIEIQKYTYKNKFGMENLRNLVQVQNSSEVPILRKCLLKREIHNDEYFFQDRGRKDVNII